MSDFKYDNIQLSDDVLFERLCEIYYTWPADGVKIFDVWSYIGTNWDVRIDRMEDRRMSKELVLEALGKSSWIQKDAAKLLGISPRAFNYRVKEYEIKHPTWKNNT